MTRAHLSLAAGGAIALVALSALGGACGPEAFATVTLQVREPAGLNRRAEKTNNIVFQLEEDAGEPRAVSFEPDAPFPTKPIVLGQEERVLIAGLSVGNRLAPDALGFANPVTIPAIASPPKQVDIKAPLILAAPNTVELLDDQRPTARNAPAVCMDGATGKGWFIGGFQQGGASLENGYAFSATDLLSKETVLTDLEPGQMACDADPFGRFVLVESRCSEDGVTGPAGRLSVGTDGRDQEEVLQSAGCSPSVSVVGNSVWVATDRFIAVHALDTLAPRANAADINATGPMVALAEDKALIVGTPDTASGTLLVTLDAFLVLRAGPRLDDVIAFARFEGTIFALTSTGLVGEVTEAAGFTDGRVVAGPDDGVPRALTILPDGRAVVLTDAVVVVEGSAPAPHGGRQGLGTTVGGAVVLVGGPDAGTDVLVPEVP